MTGRQVQFRGGGATWVNTFTGATRELAVDVTGNTIRINNGSTPGGTIHYPSSAFVGSLMSSASAAALRTALSLGTAALLNTGTGVGNILTMAAGPKLPAVDGSNLTSVVATGSVVGIQVLTAGTTYTRSAGATKGDIFLIGGSGGGGGCPATGASQYACGGGGGGGALTVAFNVALPATATIVIGAQGTVTTGGAGGNGGTTSFTGGALTLTAPGGGGGSPGGPGGLTFPAVRGVGGPAGTFTGGSFSQPGNDGEYGICLYPQSVIGGIGGLSPMWGFGEGGASIGIGASTAAFAGGQGTIGAIIVIERS